MISEERQTSFNAQYKQFGITLCMSSEEVLSIAVDNTRTLERYSRDIDYEYISQQDTFFQSVFEEVKDIYDYLKSVINEVVVDGQFLVFNYRHGNNRVKRIKIQLTSEGIDRVELVNRKMEKMQEQLTAQLLQKDIEIKELKQKYEEMTQILQQIKSEIQAEKTQTRELAETWRADFQLMKGELQTEKAKNRQLAEALRVNTEKLETVAHSISLVPVPQKKQMIKQSSKQVKVFQKIGHHPNNVHKNYFALVNLAGMSTRITRTGGNSSHYNFVNKCEMQSLRPPSDYLLRSQRKGVPSQKAKYSLTINKTKNSNIMVGFCTEEGLGNIGNYRHFESAYYYCWDTGYLYQGGSYEKIEVRTVAGETVECVAELTRNKLSWWKKGSKIAECAVPSKMRNKPIYISILLSDPGDEVDLCI